jgi:branched-chain amino acid transport system substrate-binding protein
MPCGKSGAPHHLDPQETDDVQTLVHHCRFNYLRGIVGLAHAQVNTFKIGLILQLSGPFAATDMQLESAARLSVAQHRDKVAGKKSC